MKIFDSVRNRHQDIYKIFLFILTAAIIVYMYPRQVKFRFEYSKGKPWQHETLFAPFDFAIEKTPAELAAEEKQVKANAAVYFRVDSVVQVKAAEKFAFYFAKDLADTLGRGKMTLSLHKQQLFNEGQAIVAAAYARGIVKPAEVIEKRKIEKIYLISHDNTAIEVEIKNLLMAPEVQRFIAGKLKQLSVPHHDFLEQVLIKSISPNIYFDEVTTRTVLEQQLSGISLTHGLIQKGERVIARGEVVDEESFRALESLREEFTNNSGERKLLIFLGQFLLILLCMLVLFLFLFHFRKDIISNNQRVVFILLIILLFVIPVLLALEYEFPNIYAIPFCILAVIIRTFYDTRLASFTLLITCLILGFVTPNSFEYLFIQMIAGSVAIFSIINLRMRSQLFFTTLVIFVAYFSCYIGFLLLQDNSLENFQLRQVGAFAISSILTLFAYPIIFLFEKLFGFISDVTLLEISDTNNHLLRELSLKAPGTFQHSLQVANLAEEAIFEIGGDALLVRAGALYHDIGKMDMPLYFIENQAGVNPHDEMSFEESAEIIISHVIKGVEKARKSKIPEAVIDFIRTHHGDTMVEYFYRSSLKHFPEKLIDQKKFRYPGPRPYSKETAVLMMADSVEAASRSLKTYDAPTIDKMVEDIIDYQIEQNQFDNANVTFKDISTIKKIFKKKLQNIYHVRIEYPR